MSFVPLFDTEVDLLLELQTHYQLPSLNAALCYAVLHLEELETQNGLQQDQIVGFQRELAQRHAALHSATLRVVELEEEQAVLREQHSSLQRSLTEVSAALLTQEQEWMAMLREMETLNTELQRRSADIAPLQRSLAESHRPSQHSMHKQNKAQVLWDWAQQVREDAARNQQYSEAMMTRLRDCMSILLVQGCMQQDES